MVDRQPLASWNDGAVKSAILDFVARATKPGGAEFAPPAERIAVFDNDGTLCCEQPLQIQFYFAFNRVEELAAKDPTMAERQPFKAVLEHDYNTLFGLGLQAPYELAFAPHAGITDEDFERQLIKRLQAEPEERIVVVFENRLEQLPLGHRRVFGRQILHPVKGEIELNLKR